MKEIKISLNEPNFTSICKAGFITYIPTSGTKLEITLTSQDIRDFIKGEIIKKEVLDYNFLIKVEGIDQLTLREIILRSPVFSHIAQEIPQK